MVEMSSNLRLRIQSFRKSIQVLEMLLPVISRLFKIVNRQRIQVRIIERVPVVESIPEHPQDRQVQLL